MARARGTVNETGEKLLSKSIRIPPDLWEEIEQRVPPRRRAAFVRRALERELQAPPEAEAPLAEWLTELAQAVPDEIVARLPTDGARNVDHYLRSAPAVDEG